MTDQARRKTEALIDRSEAEVLAAERRRRGPDRRKRAAKTLQPRTACPHCHGVTSHIRDPRMHFGAIEGPTYWRVRQCARCGCVYSTEEVTRAILTRPAASA